MATASVNIMFGASTAYPLLLAFWGLNGLLQARQSCARAPISHGFLVNIQLIKPSSDVLTMLCFMWHLLETLIWPVSCCTA